jgi:propionyl-CoA carboxylase alpha chain
VKLDGWAVESRLCRGPVPQLPALDQFVIDGISDNVDFLSALMQHPRFRAGDITTGFIAEEYPEGFEGAPADAQLIEDLTASPAWSR